MDIISNRGDFLSSINNTLTELIVKNFVEARKKIKANRKKIENRNQQKSKFSISAILINSVINSEIKKNKNENNEKKLEEENLEETAKEESEDEKKLIVNGGYGTISKHYGFSPVVKYADYDKIWSHLGSFRTYNMHENTESPNEIAMKNGESSREMVNMETIDKAARHFKYFVRGELIGEVGIVPPVGLNINSKDWEQYRLMTFMSIYRPLLKLMRSMV